jgi:hypothetical protein
MTAGAGRLQVKRRKVSGFGFKVKSAIEPEACNLQLHYLTMTVIFFVPQGDLKTTVNVPGRLLTEVIE